MSKLYTEEQVKKAIAIGIQVGYSEEFNIDNFDMEVDDAVFFIPSIELPSDEEIEKHIESDFNNSIWVKKYPQEAQLPMKATCIAGAKWMKEQILNQNK